MVTTTTQTDQPAETVLSAGQGHQFFDRQARLLLNMSGAEFLQRGMTGNTATCPTRPRHARSCGSPISFPLVGKNPREAHDAFIEPFRRAVQCVAAAKVFTSGYAEGRVHAVACTPHHLEPRN